MVDRRTSGRRTGMILLPALAGALSAGVCAQTTAPSTTQPTGTQSPAGARLPDLVKIKKSLTELRGQPFKKDVPARQQSLEEWGEYIDREIEKYFPPERREGMEQGLLRLGMLTKPIDIDKELRGALQSQAGAYYDPGTGTFFYLMVDLPEEALETIAAHELVHALQDQYFDLEAMTAKVEEGFHSGERNDDQLLALRTLIEGEATYVHTLWQVKNLMGMDLSGNPQTESFQFKMMADMDIDQLVELTKQQTLPMLGEGEDNPIAKAVAEMDKIPPYFLHPLYAAYMKGAYFTMSLRHDGGWDAVAAALENPPISTEQTIYPEKYLAERDDPTRIELPALTVLTDSGWSRIDAAIHGEFYLSGLLQNFGVPASAAKEAARGWDGDIYHAYRHRDGRVLIVLATTWDTEKDAQEFYEAYRSMLSAKYPKLEAQAGTPDDVSIYDCGDPQLGHGRVQRRGQEVFVVEGGSPAEGQKLMESLLELPIEHVP